MDFESIVSTHIEEYDDLGRDKIYESGDIIFKELNSLYYKDTDSVSNNLTIIN